MSRGNNYGVSRVHVKPQISGWRFTERNRGLWSGTAQSRRVFRCYAVEGSPSSSAVKDYLIQPFSQSMDTLKSTYESLEVESKIQNFHISESLEELLGSLDKDRLGILNDVKSIIDGVAFPVGGNVETGIAGLGAVLEKLATNPSLQKLESSTSHLTNVSFFSSASGGLFCG